MNPTARDKKLMMILLPVITLVAFWFLLLGPKRHDAARAGDGVATAQQKRDQARAQVAQLEGAKTNYAEDYATVVRLGKAIPDSLDMPSLIVQLNSAAKGTGIGFRSIKAGTRTSAALASAASPAGSSPAPSGGSSSSGGAVANGQPAATGPGKVAEKANGAAKTSDQANQTAGADSSSTVSTGNGAVSSPAPAVGAGLDTVPLEFTFSGSFFDLADFFHSLKRFVRVTNSKISVQGRLMTIDSVSFDSATFPKLQAQVKSTVYLSPKSEGTTAGGTPAGPQATPATGAAPAAPTQTPAAASTPPAGGQTQ